MLTDFWALNIRMERRLERPRKVEPKVEPFFTRQEPTRGHKTGQKLTRRNMV